MVAIGRALPSGVREWMYKRELRKTFPYAHLNSDRVSLSAELGREVTIGEHVVVGDEVRIGDFTSVNRGTMIFSGSVGRFTSIAQFVHIGGHRHPMEHLSTSPRVYRADGMLRAFSEYNELSEPPVIGSDVWIGAGAIITQGVMIGHGAVVGAGSVVTRDVSPYTIAVGAPARPLRPRFPENVRNRLLDLAWWEWDVSRLSELRSAIDAGAHFFEHLPASEAMSSDTPAV